MTTKNWCDIPTELKALCIEEMDFKTLCRLRVCSKLSKALVEKKQYNFEKVKIKYDKLENTFSVSADSKSGSKIYFDRIPTPEDENMQLSQISRSLFDDTIYCQKSIFARSKMSYLSIGLENPRGADAELMLYGAQSIPHIATSSISIYGCGELSIAVELLRKCEPTLKSIRIYFECYGVGFSGQWESHVAKVNYRLIREIFEMESVKKAGDVWIEAQVLPFQKNLIGSAFEGVLTRIVENWISENREIGTLLRLPKYAKNAKDDFLTHFQSRLLTQNAQIITIRTDDPGKLINFEWKLQALVKIVANNKK